MATTLTVSRLAPIMNMLWNDPSFGAFTYSQQINSDVFDTLANGTAIDQADLLHVKRYTIASTATPQNLNLSDGSLLTPGHGAAAFVKVTSLLVFNRSATAGEILTVGGGSSYFAALGSAGQAVGPGGWEFKHDPSLAAMAVTASTADILKLAIAAGINVAVDVWIIGRSA